MDEALLLDSARDITLSLSEIAIELSDKFSASFASA
jgi:hypothetical protein